MKHQIKTDLIRGYCAQSMQLRHRPMERPPYPRAPRLGPWAFSISVVNSLERDFVGGGYSYVNASISS